MWKKEGNISTYIYQLNIFKVLNIDLIVIFFLKEG